MRQKWRILRAIIAGAVLIVFGVINFQKSVIWFVLLLLGVASIGIGVKLIIDARKIKPGQSPSRPPAP